MFVKIVWILSIFAATNGLIVPGELPTILSLVYSNIPTIKKGTDSRLGWGFRLGDRAEFQVLVELGPQTNTQPLGNQPQSSSNSKRNSPETLANVLYAQRQHEKAQFSNTEGGKWMKEWSQFVKNGPLLPPPPLPMLKLPKPPALPKFPLRIRPPTEISEDENENTVLGIGEIDAKSVIPEDDVKIETIVVETTSSPTESTATTTTTTTTSSKKDASGNVAVVS